jgi:hypothetical protein
MKEDSSDRWLASRLLNIYAFCYFPYEANHKGPAGPAIARRSQTRHGSVDALNNGTPIIAVTLLGC